MKLATLKFMLAAFLIIYFLVPSENSYALTNSASSSTSPANMNSSVLSISKFGSGQDLTILSIDSLPPALNRYSNLVNFTTYMFYFLFAAGIIFSLWEGYRLELTGQSFNYYDLFLRTVLIAVGFLSWKSAGTSNFTEDILTIADKLQLYLLKINVFDYGSISQINASILSELRHLSLPTVSTNGTSSVKSGWNLNPFSWFAGAVHALTGRILLSIIWFLFNLFYLVIQLGMAFVQLIILGILVAICPIILGFETIPYTRKVFGKWLKIFIEVSCWGIVVALEQLVFFTILVKIASVDFSSSGYGFGQFLGALTFAEDVVIFICMAFLSITVPFIVGKLFDSVYENPHKGIARNFIGEKK